MRAGIGVDRARCNFWLILRVKEKGWFPKNILRTSYDHYLVRGNLKKSGTSPILVIPLNFCKELFLLTRSINIRSPNFLVHPCPKPFI
jgi:hypothetical protein